MGAGAATAARHQCARRPQRLRLTSESLLPVPPASELPDTTGVAHPRAATKHGLCRRILLHLGPQRHASVSTVPRL